MSQIRSRFSKFTLVALLTMMANPCAFGQTARDTLTPLLRAIDASDAELAAAATAVAQDEAASKLPNPAELFRRASSSPTDIPGGLSLVEASEAWYQRMSFEGGARLVMVGLDSATVRAAARAVVALSAGATVVLDRAIDAADRASDDGHAEVADDVLSEALHARQVVLPLRAARGALVLASSASSKDDKHKIAALALESSLRVEPVSAWSDAERLVISGWALVLLDRNQEALTAFDKARTAVSAKDASDAVRADVLIDAALGESLALLAWRGPVTARESMQKRLSIPPFVENDRVELWSTLAGLEVLLRIAPLEAATFQDASARSAAMSWPWRTIESALPRLDIAQRGIVYAHAGRRLSAVVAFESLPATARVAFAWTALSQEAPDFDSAQRVLAPLADPEQAPADVVHRDASRLFCRAGVMSGDAVVLERVDRVGLAFAECCAEDAGVGEILIAAAHAAEKRLNLLPAVEDAAPARRDLIASLRALSTRPLQMEDAQRDPWRVTLGRLLLGMIARSPWSDAIALANEARSTLRLVTSGALLAESEQLLIDVWMSLLRVVEDSDDEEGPVARTAAELSALCDPKQSRASKGDWTPALLETMAIGRSRALIAMRRPDEALAEIAPFIGTDLTAAPQAIDAGVEALVLLGREEEARQLIGRSVGAPVVLSRLSQRAWRSIEGLTTGFIAGEAPPKIPPPSVVFRLAAETSTVPDVAAMHRTRLAWALLLGGDAEASAAAFRAAMQLNPESAGLRRGLGEALLVLKDEEGAFRLFNEIARGLGARQEFSRDYWHAWTRMLEILSRRTRTPDEDTRIRREIARLRSLDSALEQPDCMVRIKVLEERLK